MLRRGAIRWWVALFLAAVLASPALAAPRSAVGLPALPSLGQLWEAAASWLAGAFGWQSTAEGDCDHGSYIDPDGRCVPLEATTDTTACDHGSYIDPNGLCVSLDTTICGHGSSIDPNGRCVPTGR